MNSQEDNEQNLSFLRKYYFRNYAKPMIDGGGVMLHILIV